jgi:trk system potassium uptake protein
VGPLDNYAHMPPLAKWILSACMLLGRLEIYTLLILLLPEFWKK